MNVKLNVHYRDARTKLFKRILSYCNPEASNENLLELVRGLNGLTNNTIVEVIKIVKRYLDEEDIFSSFGQEDVDFVFDGNGFFFNDFSQNDLDFIFDDNDFSFDNFTQADVDFIFN